MKNIIQNIDKRKTCAIIAHPDSGKTTLTEKLLLYGGAINQAGAVKSNKIQKSTTSDFMEIEKQRGISVATSVMAFEYQDQKINILDTPGHKDFAEDTYRTLTAVDSVILVIDCVKGVEEQTLKLMQVCRMRDTPVIVFINKMDRDGKDPYDLLEEVEGQLGIQVHPMAWPIGGGKNFKGVYSLHKKELNLYSANAQTKANEFVSFDDLSAADLDKQIGESYANQLREDAELIGDLYGKLNPEDYYSGQTAPVFFGSAVNSFGVQELLHTFLELAPKPKSRPTTDGERQPENEKFSGFVFKIHANLDPKHRDRIAFLRVCSGVFERNKFFFHVRNEKKMRFSNPTSFMANEKEIVEEAFPGDVVGLYDSGNFKIGDTLTEGEKFLFKGIPSFSPELFRELENKDPMKSKQLEKGIQQLTDEGVAQLFTRQPGNIKVVGVVGQLQFEVIQYRLEHEYGAKAQFRPITAHKAYWVTGPDEAKEDLIRRKQSFCYIDKDGLLVYLAESAYMIQIIRDDFPKLEFHETSEFKLD